MNETERRILNRQDALNKELHNHEQRIKNLEKDMIEVAQELHNVYKENESR